MAYSGNVWTRKLIGAARKILSHYTDINEALPHVSKAVGWTVTRPSLDSAFKRFGEATPMSCLKDAPLSPRDELVKRVEAKQAARNRRQDGITQLILEKVEAALSKVKPDTLKIVQEPPAKKIPEATHELIWAEISDVQLGTKVELEAMGGINEHNWAIWLAKLARWEETITQTIRERRKAVNVDGVVLALLGDIVEGHNIFKGQVYELDYDVYKQVIHGASDFAQAFARLAATFPDLQFTLYGVGGNHGRVGSYGEAPYRCNWDLVLYHLIELRLKALNLSNVTCHFPEAWFQLVETWGWTHLLVHGDDIKGWGGLPFYGLQRAVGKYQQVLQKPVNYLHIGHFHAEAGISSSLGDMIVNGNWIGANAFSKQIVEANTPVQLVHGISEANGIEWTKKIYLRTRQSMRPKVAVYRHGARKRSN